MDHEHPTWSVLRRAADLFQKLCQLGICVVILVGVTIWLPDSKQQESTLLKSKALASPNAMERILAISASDDGQYLDVVQGNTQWSRRDAHTGSELFSRKIPVPQFLRPKICGKGEWLVGLNEWAELEIFHQQERVRRHDLVPPETSEYICECSLSGDGTRIAAVSDRGSLWLMDLEGSRVTSMLHHKLESGCVFVELSATGDRVALVDGKGRLLIWDEIQQTAVPLLDADHALCRFASWSDNERWLITYGGESTIRIWNAETMTMVRRWNERSQIVSIARLSADGRRTAIANDQSISIWDFEGEQELAILEVHQGRITDLKFGNDGVTLFSSDATGGLRRWSLPDQRVVWSIP